MNNAKEVLKHQPNSKTELSAIIRWCMMLAKQAKWNELNQITRQLIGQFPDNLSVIELFLTSSTRLRNWQELNDFLKRSPSLRNLSNVIDVSLFDFFALSGDYDELIQHVWSCIAAGANEELLAYLEPSLINLKKSDPAFSHALSCLSGNKLLSPLGLIIDSFANTLISDAESKQSVEADNLSFSDLFCGFQPNSGALSDPHKIPDDHILRPSAPADMGLLSASCASEIDRVDVIIPVYAGFEETMRCITSVLRNKQKQSFSVIVVDDFTPDRRISDALDELSNAGLIELHRNASNQGFVRSCNYAASLHPDRDIILLNSDTEVFGDWIDRIIDHALRTPDAGTITPLSNNATICSYPQFASDNSLPKGADGEMLDGIAASVNSHMGLIEVPTGVGFCMFVRRSCIKEFGLFNSDAFGTGYGEENDFCQRILASGKKNYLAPNIFVFHAGATSFGASSSPKKKNAMAVLRQMHPAYDQSVRDHIERDPARACRARIDTERLKLLIAGSQGAILHVTHRLGGGTAKHVRELCQYSVAEGKICLVAEPLEADNDRFGISFFGDGSFPNLPTFSCFENPNDLLGFLSYIGVDHIHIHHLLGYGHLSQNYFLTVASSIPTDFTAHDYFAICPRINLVDGTGKYCGEPSLEECGNCTANFGSYIPPYVTVEDWRRSNIEFLSGMRRIFAPSEDCGNRLSKYIDSGSVSVRPHAVDCNRVTSKSAVYGEVQLTRSTSFRKVVILGAISEIKGEKIVRDVAAAAKALQLPLTFHIIGYGTSADAFADLDNVFVSGKYEEEALSGLISLVDGDFQWVPSIWPETFCYAMMEGVFAGLMPVCFDIGAQAEHVRNLCWGNIIPLEYQYKPRDVAIMLSTISACRSFEPDLRKYKFDSFDRYYFGPRIQTH